MICRTFLLLCTCHLLGFLALQAEETLPLSAPYDALYFGEDGGLAVLHVFEKSELRAIDLSTRKERFRIAEVPEGDLLAVGAEDLVVVSPGNLMVRRWDLKSGKRQKVALLEDVDTPQRLVMGSACKGPLFLFSSTSCQLLDGQTLKPIKLPAGSGVPPEGLGRHGVSLMVSNDGSTIGRIPVGYGPVGYSVTQWSGSEAEPLKLRQVKFGSTSNAIRWAQPTADGRLLLLPGGAVHNRNGRELKTAWLEGSALVPSSDPALFLAVDLDARDAADQASVRLSVCSTSDCRPLFHDSGYSELRPKRISSWHDIVAALRSGTSWRIHHLPQEQLLLTFPTSNDRIIFRSFDVDQRMKDLGVSKLAVTSAPPATVRRNSELRYAVTAKHYGVTPKKAGRKLSYELLDGPTGAVINKKGVLVWQAPEALLERQLRFLIAVRGGGDNGSEALHGFEVDVLKPR